MNNNKNKLTFDKWVERLTTLYSKMRDPKRTKPLTTLATELKIHPGIFSTLASEKKLVLISQKGKRPAYAFPDPESKEGKADVIDHATFLHMRSRNQSNGKVWHRKQLQITNSNADTSMLTVDFRRLTNAFFKTFTNTLRDNIALKQERDRLEKQLYDVRKLLKA